MASRYKNPMMARIGGKMVRGLHLKEDSYLSFKDLSDGLGIPFPGGKRLSTRLERRGIYSVVVDHKTLTGQSYHDNLFKHPNLYVSVTKIKDFAEECVRMLGYETNAGLTLFEPLFASLPNALDLSWNPDSYMLTRSTKFAKPGDFKAEVAKRAAPTPFVGKVDAVAPFDPGADDSATQIFFYEAVRNRALANHFYANAKRNEEMLPPHLAQQVASAAKGFFRRSSEAQPRQDGFDDRARLDFGGRSPGRIPAI